MADIETNWLKWVTELQAIAQNGLTFTSNEFDKERYQRLREIAAELASNYTDQSPEALKNLFDVEKGYATPKIDVRSFIVQDNKVLLVKERADGLWTLPGGWADVNESPSEAVIRETLEEAGFEVSALRLLAFWDKLKHEHPPQWPHTYKCFFHCEIISGERTPNIEISEIDFFDLEALPPLSLSRITAKQIKRLYEIAFHSDKTFFD